MTASAPDPHKRENKCECARCPDCDGSGSVWFSFGHKHYLGSRRCDDLDELETCEECWGSGLADGPCDYCAERVEDENP